MTTSAAGIEARADRLLSDLKGLADDRGAMAALRRGLSPALAHYAWPYVARWCDLTNDHDRAVLSTVAGAFASHPLHTDDPEGNLGATLRHIAVDQGGEKGLASFKGRFRRLISCNRSEISERVGATIRAAAQRGVPVNYRALFMDLMWWGERVKVRWAEAFLGRGPRGGEGMSFLTRIRVGGMQAVRSRLTDAYAWHKALWRAFPDRDGEPREFLTRIDRRDDAVETLMLSPLAPELPEWGLWEIKEVPDAFLGRERYLFSLRANPTTKRVVRDDAGARRKNGRRTRIIDPAALEEWLGRKASGSGFAVEDGTLRSTSPVDQKSFKQGKTVTHSRVDFTGVLRVTDRDSFASVWRRGIGPAKAFGFGMLLLKPMA